MNWNGFFRLFLCLSIAVSLSTAASAQENATQETVASSTEEVKTPATLSSLAVNPATEIVRIKEQQTQLQATLKKQDEAMAAAEATPVVDAYKKQLDAINNLNLMLSQQISAYEKHIDLREEFKQIQASHETLQSTTAVEAVSFLEFNNLSEQVNAEINREQNINSRIELAKSALDQAKVDEQARQTQVNELQVKLDNAVEEEQKTVLQIDLITANYELRLAKERVQLRNVELKNEYLNKEVYQARIAFLKDRLERNRTHVEFTQEQLQEQIDRLDKLQLDLEKKRERLTSNKSDHELKLQAFKNKAAQSTDLPQSMLDERKALELQSRWIDRQIQHCNEQIQQISTRKEIWNRRFDVFNQNVEKPVMIEWKTEANKTIDTLNSADQSILLDLDSLQTDLTNVRSLLANLSDDQSARQKPLQEQEAQYQNIINSYRDHQNFIEVTRRQAVKLVNEVDQVLAVRSWQEIVHTWLKKEIFFNTYGDWAFAIGLLVVVFIVFIIVRWIILSRVRALAAKHPTPVFEGLLDVIQRTRPTFFFVWSVFIASTYLQFTEDVKGYILSFMLLALTLQGAIMASYFIQAYLKNFFEKKAKQDQTLASARAIFNFISQLIVWSLALYLGLMCFDIEATPLITGLGIGGLAVALALQNILGDLFASLSIVIDKPFVVGDFVILDTYMGSIEHIGIKTTRIRSLSGEQIICSNGDLLAARIRNYKRMLERRVAFPVGVTYQTSADQLKMIPEIIKTAVENNDNARFDRSHFKEFGDFSLNFETVYYVLSNDYAMYMDIQQNINLEIYQKFAEHGIEFSYPTQTLFLEKTNASPEVHEQ